MSGDVVVSAASPAREIPKGLLAICYLLLTTCYLLIPVSTTIFNADLLSYCGDNKMQYRYQDDKTIRKSNQVKLYYLNSICLRQNLADSTKSV